MRLLARARRAEEQGPDTDGDEDEPVEGEEDEDHWWLIFRTLSERYGWTPQQIGELTMNQLLYYTSSGDPAELTDDPTPEQLDEMFADADGQESGG